MGHRLELSFKDAIKDVPIHKKLDGLLSGLLVLPLQPSQQCQLKEQRKGPW